MQNIDAVIVDGWSLCKG